MARGGAATFEHHHYPGLAHPDHLAMVELHTELFATRRRQRLLRAAEVSGASRPVSFAGGRARLPSVEHQVVHLVAHCQVSHRGHHCAHVQLRDRLEAAALERWSFDCPDWTGIARRFAAAGYRRHLLTFLLSLDDIGFPRGPAGVEIGTLATALRRRRIAVQARSATMMQFGARLGSYAAVLNGLIFEPEERRRLARLSLVDLARKLQRKPASR